MSRTVGQIPVGQMAAQKMLQAYFQVIQSAHTADGKGLEDVCLGELIESAKQQYWMDVLECRTSDLVAGTRTCEKGTTTWRLKDQRGQEQVLSSGPCTIGELPDPQTLQSPSILQPASNCGGVANENSHYIEELRSLIERDPTEAAIRVLEELSRGNLPPDRKRLLIFAADELWLPDAGLQQRLCAQLLHHAAELKQSSSPEDGPAVNCAIRRAGSILSVDRLSDLLPFLQIGSQADTRLVTLQAISSIFLQSPAPDGIDTQDIALRALTIAEKHWDPDVFRAGEISALAIEATVATATLDPEAAKSLPAVAAQTKRRLLLRKVCQRLADVRANWKQTSADDFRIPALDRLVQEFEDVANSL